MGVQQLHEALIQRFGPEGVKQAFYYGQIFLGAVFLGAIWLGRPRRTESGFAVREADLRKKELLAGRNRPGVVDLASARMERKAPLSLPGIRIDGPPHEILGIRPDASPDEIQRAYRERMKQYHPDKVGPQGTRQWTDAQKIAEAINRAKTEMLRRVQMKR